MIWNTMLAVHCAPIAVWLSGAVEGVGHCCYHVARIAKNALFNQPEQKEAARNDLYRNVNITKSCLIVAAVSTPPLLGTFFGFFNIITEEAKYMRIEEAVRRLRFYQTTQSKECHANLMEKDPTSEDLLANRASLLQEYEEGEQFHLQDLKGIDSHLDNSLINKYYVFYITHHCLKQGLGLKIVGRGIMKTVRVANHVFQFLRKQWIAKWLTYFALSRLIDLGRFNTEVLTQELKIVLQ